MSDVSKPAKSQSTDNETMENFTKFCDSLLNDKALKKKLKKERQKDKKNHGKTKPDCERDETNKSESSEKSDNVEKKIVTNDNDDNNDSCKSDDGDESTDINYAMESAFIQSIVNKNDTVKMLKKNDAGKVKDSTRDTSHLSNKLFPDDSDGFTPVKKGGKMVPITFCRTPEGFGIEALKVIRAGKYELAINYLTRAIALDQTDTRHYINRSYCYLRLGNFSQALADIQYASEHFSDITEMSQAKCREGQAYCGLQNFEAAERAFNESMNLSPSHTAALREMKRMQVLQMTRMGFNERDALLALQTYPKTTDAINFLAENASMNTNYDSTGSEIDDEDEIFYSDSEDDPSNERILSKMINYNPNISNERRIYDASSNKEIIKNLKQLPRASSADRTLRVIKAVPVQPTPKKLNQTVNSKAIWVGSITPIITETLLLKRFSRFGKVVSIWKSASENYAFINFQCATGPQKAFEEAKFNGGNIDFNGSIKLPIKEATVKSMK